MSVIFSNATFTAAQSSTGVFALNSFTGANVLSGVAPVTVNGTIDQPGSVVQVSLNIGGVTTAGAQGTYLGFTALPSVSSDVYYFSVTGANITTPVIVAVTGSATLPAIGVAQTVTTANVTAPASPVPCFATGTRIRTPRGEVPVEQLAVGDSVVLAHGGERPIVWIGQRTTNCTSRLNRHEALPVRIKAGAFAENQPARDLVVSPGHRLFTHGGLVTAFSIVNGRSITQDAVDQITYWHVELDRHDVVLAEGLAAESYLDCGNRNGFDGNANVVVLRPALDGVGIREDCCAPMYAEGPQLEAIDRMLRDRADMLFGSEDMMHVANGR